MGCHCLTAGTYGPLCSIKSLPSLPVKGCDKRKATCHRNDLAGQRRRKSSYDPTITDPHHLSLLWHRLRAVRRRGGRAGGGTGVHARAPGQRRISLCPKGNAVLEVLNHPAGLMPEGSMGRVDDPSHGLRSRGAFTAPLLTRKGLPASTRRGPT